MALTKRQRKDRLKRGKQREIAIRLGFPESAVSAVMNNKAQMYSKETVERIRLEIAKEIGEPVQEVFAAA